LGKRQFFRQKIAENCDHNIDPRYDFSVKYCSLIDGFFSVDFLRFSWTRIYENPEFRVARWYIFKPKIPKFGMFCRAFEWNILVYLMAILYFVIILHIFPTFWWIVPSKIWQPWSRSWMTDMIVERSKHYLPFLSLNKLGQWDERKKWGRNRDEH
jgi:hypothetical protein